MNLQTLKISLSIKDRILENLHIVNLLQNSEIRDIMENITGNTFETAHDFLKYKILNYIKNTKYIKEIQCKDNQDIVQIIKNQEKIELRDTLIASIISSEKDKIDVSKCISINELKIILKDPAVLSIDDVEIINPFNDLKIKISSSNEIEKSFSVSNETKKNNKDFNNTFHIFISKKNKNNDLRKGDNLLMDFILYHELAHSSYAQILSNYDYDRNSNEINSDIVSIIKIINENDFSISQTNKLCNVILDYRAKTARYDKKTNLQSYMDGYANVRCHFTEESILNFKDFIKVDNNINYIKEIKDADLSSFAQIFHMNTKNLNNCIDIQSTVIKNYDIILETLLDNPLYFKTMKNDYNESHTNDLIGLTNYSEKELKKMNPVTVEYINKMKKNIINASRSSPHVFKDIFINYQLRTNFNNYIFKNENKKIIENNFSDIILKFENYKNNKSGLKLDIDSKTTSRQLLKKIKIN